MPAEPGSAVTVNLRREPMSVESSVPGVWAGSDSLSGMMKGKPEVRTWAYPSEQAWAALESGNTMADKQLGMFPNEWKLRGSWIVGRKRSDEDRTNEAEMDRLGGCGRLVGASVLRCHTPKG